MSFNKKEIQKKSSESNLFKIKIKTIFKVSFNEKKVQRKYFKRFFKEKKNQIGNFRRAYYVQNNLTPFFKPPSFFFK